LALLASGLLQNSFKVDVIALDRGGRAEADLKELGIEPIVIGRRAKFGPLALLRLRRHIKRLSPQIVHIWQPDAISLALLPTGSSRVGLTERNLDVAALDYYLILKRRLARRAARIVVNAAAVRDYFVAHHFEPDKFAIIPAGVPAVKSAQLTREELLTKLGLPADAKLIAYIGALEVRKRIKELIWAIDQLRAVNTPAHVLIIGAGPQRSRLERYTRQNRIESRTHFLGPRDDLTDIVPHLNVLWQPSASEGHSIAILEAMAAGIPVVAADAPGNRDLVVPDQTGYLVPLGERAGFARATLPILEDRELAGRLGAAARQRATECFPAQQMIDRHIDLYRQLEASRY
jgi:glycosyltransferase involved in cell wall biosynthesis